MITAFDEFANTFSATNNDTYKAWSQLSHDRKKEMWKEYPDIARAVVDVLYAENCLFALVIVEREALLK